MQIGQMVRFPVNTLHGIAKRVGVVKRILDDQRVEVKAQSGGYYILRIDEVSILQASAI